MSRIKKDFDDGETDNTPRPRNIYGPLATPVSIEDRATRLEEALREIAGLEIYDCDLAPGIAKRALEQWDGSK